MLVKITLCGPNRVNIIPLNEEDELEGLPTHGITVTSKWTFSDNHGFLNTRAHTKIRKDVLVLSPRKCLEVNNGHSLVASVQPFDDNTFDFSSIRRA